MSEAYEKKYLCKYKVPTLVIMKGETSIPMDASNILSIDYINDYDTNLRAILKVSLRIDVRKKIWILRNKLDIRCKFELVKFGSDYEIEGTVTSDETVWNGEFAVFFNDDDESADTRAMEQRIAKNEGDPFAFSDISSESYFESQNMLDLYLFNPSLLSASNVTYNDIYTNNTLQTCVGKLLTKTKHDNVLMSKFENDEIYNELLVPALPAWKALAYLDQYYGFYKKGAIIYYDIDALYILNSSGKVTAKREDEWASTTIWVTTLDGGTPGNGMLRREGEKTNYISINENNISPTRPSIANNAAYGSTAKIVITDDTSIDVKEANQSYIDQRNERISYLGKDHNKFSASISKARMEENETMIYITAENLDINAFTINKEYTIVYNETSKQSIYGNDTKYRLVYASHQLKAKSGNYMDSSHYIVLKKASSDDEDPIEE